MGAHGLVIPRKSHLRFRWNDVGAADLRRFAQGEADRCAALRALAIAQALEGASRAEAARFFGRKRQSLRDAVREPGCWPDPEADGLCNYRLVDIAGHIKQRWSVSYGLSSVSGLLHRMGLSLQTTRPIHPKRARSRHGRPTCLRGQPGYSGPALRPKR